MNLASKAAVILAVPAILTGWGCGGGGTPSVSGSSQEVPVKGTVTIQGKPTTGGEIIFDPSNIKRPDAKARTAPIGKDGSYTITTLVGENTVTVSGKGVPVNSNSVVVPSGGDTLPIDI